MKRLAYLSLTVLVVVADLVSKSAAFAALGAGETKWIFGEFLGLTEVLNPGITGGMLGSALDAKYITILTGLATIAILVYMLRSRSLGRVHLVGLALILGGAIGNLYDRLQFGKVRDFIDVWPRLAFPSDRSWLYHWPTFNLADSAIVVAVGLMVAHWLFAGRKGKAGAASTGA